MKNFHECDVYDKNSAFKCDALVRVDDLHNQIQQS